MRARPFVLGILSALLFVFARPALAEPPAVEKIVALNKSAIAAFNSHDNDKAKDQLMEAVVLGKENGLGMHAAMARTYLHLGVVYVDGFKDTEKGQRYFGMAQKVRPDIDLTPALASPTVVAAWKAAGGKAEKVAAQDSKTEAKPEAKAEAKAEPEPKPETKAEAKAREKAEKAQKAEEAKLAKERERADRNQKVEEAKTAQTFAMVSERKEAEAKEREAKKEAEVKEREAKKEADAKDREAKLRDERDKAQKELAQLRESEKKERAEKERLVGERDKLQKELADARGAEKKEREGREKAEKVNQENGKLIAETSGREKKEREAREKLEKEQQAALAKETARKDREAQEKAAREKLAEGPDLPSSVPTPLFCPTNDGVVGADLYVHCVPQDKVKAKSLVLYYRPSGNAHYDAVTMNHGKKGWWSTAIPANRVTGKALQYYVEARGPKDDVAASNGKGDSPNILSLHAASDPNAVKPVDIEALARAASKTSAKTPAKATARKTAASKRSKARR